MAYIGGALLEQVWDTNHDGPKELRVRGQADKLKFSLLPFKVLNLTENTEQHLLYTNLHKEPAYNSAKVIALSKTVRPAAQTIHWQVSLQCFILSPLTSGFSLKPVSCKLSVISLGTVPGI